MGQKVFISRSPGKDELFPRIDNALSNVGYETVNFDWAGHDGSTLAKDLKKEMKSCKACFVFPASEATEQAGAIERLVAETTIASSLDLPIILFKEEGEEFNINYPFLDVYVSYDREKLPLQLQEQIEEMEETKGHEGLGLLGGGLLGIAAVGTGGAALVGALIGGALLAGKEQKALVECPNCERIFGYWGKDSSLTCPNCHDIVDSQTDAVEPDRID